MDPRDREGQPPSHEPKPSTWESASSPTLPASGAVAPAHELGRRTKAGPPPFESSREAAEADPGSGPASSHDFVLERRAKASPNGDARRGHHELDGAPNAGANRSAGAGANRSAGASSMAHASTDVRLPARPHDDPLGAVGLREGTLVNGTYRVERALGAGGMGVVALAVDEALDRKVAIKFIRPELFAYPEMRTFFHNEARAMARVSHRNVLSVFAFGEHEGTPYFVMEYVDGQTADQWLRHRPRDGYPDVEEAIGIIDQACLGVSAIHETSTIHRDLKPSNLLIDRSKGPRSHAPHAPRFGAPSSDRSPESGFRVAVGDLGVARVLDSATGGNFIVGSAAWMAPEAVLGEDEAPELANRRDIYALGCIAYELLTGRTPFVGPTDMSILSQHVLEEPTPPSHVRPDLPASYDSIVLRALAKDPRKRWSSPESFRRALLAEHTGAREPERILIVDDDLDWRSIIGSSLATRFPDAVIDQVGDGRTALVAFDQNPYSVVLVDLEMPGIDGARLTMMLRQLERAERTPIIVLTAAGGPREWQKLSAMGADAFLVKPVNADDVELVIRRTIRSRCASMPPSSPSLPALVSP